MGLRLLQHNQETDEQRKSVHKREMLPKNLNPKTKEKEVQVSLGWRLKPGGPPLVMLVR